jgi:DNA-binding Xre family transcriptional regulator
MGYIPYNSTRLSGLGYIALHVPRKKLQWTAIYQKRGSVTVNAKAAVAKRILELCQQRTISVNTLANISGMPPSTVYSMLNTKSGNPGVISIQKLCDGLGISMRNFFDSPLFEELEQVIK